MKHRIIYGSCLIFCCFFSSASLAVPFTIAPKSGTSLPTSVYPGSFATAYYTVSNNTSSQRNNNAVKYLPPNVVQVTQNATYSDTCGSSFNLAPKGQTGDSCTLQLSVTGSVSASDSSSSNHIFICFPGGKTCAGTKYALNVSQKVTNMTPYVNWINSLNTDGYEVTQGNVFLMENSDCPKFISIFNSCFDQNPAAPYIIPQPPVKTSYVDPFYGTPLTTTTATGEPTNIIYRLGNNDALISIVSYPPKAAYLGYQSYLFTGLKSDYPVPENLQVVSPNPARYEIFGSVGNNINSVIVQNQLGVSPWGTKVVVYITSANKQLAEKLVSSASLQNLNSNSLFIEPIGSNVVTGNNSAANDLVTLIRYAVPQSSSASNTWINSIDNNFLVYKVTNNNIPVTRYGVNSYTARVGTTDERSLEASLDILAGLLKNYLETAQGEPAAIKLNIPSSQDNGQGIPSAGFVGSVCIAKGTICDGDNQDTSTYAIRALQFLGASETAFIAGVNHNELNNTYYVSLAISNGTTSSGVASSSQTNPSATGFDSGILTGSAKNVLDALGIAIPNAIQPHLSKLYVSFIARDCNNATIQAAKDYCIDLQGTSLVPANDKISITERSYIKPGTTTGGNVNVMIYPRIIADVDDFSLRVKDDINSKH